MNSLVSLLGVLPYWKFGPWPETPFMLGDIPLQIHSFGLMVAIGLLIGFTYTSWRGENRYGVSGETVQNFCLFLVVIGWPLSHVFNVLFYEPHLIAEDPLVLFKIWGSISSYGGLIGGIIAFLIWSYRHPELTRREWGELGIVGIVVPWFFGRIGCATVHDHPGALAPDWFLALDFPARANLPAGPRHDLGFYEAILWGVILLVVVILDRKPRREYFFAGIIPMMYAPGRFLFDFLRVPADMGGDARYLGLTPAQYLSMGIFALGAFFLWKSTQSPVRKWRTYTPPEKTDGEVIVDAQK